MSKNLFRTFVFVAAALGSVSFGSREAFALPLAPRGFESVQIPSSFTPNYDFEGIVALSNCSGSLFQFKNSKDTDLAYVLTNGHCYEGGFSKPGEYIYGVASTRKFELLNSDAKTVATLTAKEVVYSTMTNTDITIYRLNESYASIKARTKDKQMIRPFMLSYEHPAVKNPMQVVSGYWRRGYSCFIDNFVFNLKEDQWTFVDSIRYSRPGCETIGGTSGSPIILTGTRTVIGINNTGNENGEKCTMDNPCEVDVNGKITFEKGLSYGQETFWIYSCLNSNNEIDLNVTGCLLPHKAR